MSKTNISVLLAIAFLIFTGPSLLAQERATIYLWEGAVPGETEAKQIPDTSDNRKGNTLRLAKVTNPMLTIFEPAPDKRNGGAVLVCPGGGYNILALDKEGFEVAEWLSELGFTAFVLQYRVPGKRETAIYDAQRAIRYVRSQAGKWDLDSDKIGVMGFSAGGDLSARTATRFAVEEYPGSDAIDQHSARPDFTLLIYPAYLDQGEDRSLTPGLMLTEDTPPMFIFATADDRWANSALVMAGALRDASIPVELHLLPTGGHGYGMRPGNIAGETWPGLAEKWLNTLGY